MRTNLYKGIEGSCTIYAQFLAETEGRKMRFPKIIKHRRFEATIYGKSKNYPAGVSLKLVSVFCSACISASESKNASVDSAPWF